MGYEIRITPAGAPSPSVTIVMELDRGCVANGSWHCRSGTLGSGSGQWRYSSDHNRISFFDASRGQRILWIDGIRVYDPGIIYRDDEGNGEVLVTGHFPRGPVSARVIQGLVPRDRRLIQ